MAAPGGLQALPGQPGAKVRVIVDFTVQDQHITPARRDHGLVPGLGQVLNGQAHMAQGHPGPRIFPIALAIRPAMKGLPAAAFNNSALIGQLAPYPNYSPHRLFTPDPFSNPTVPCPLPKPDELGKTSCL